MKLLLRKDIPKLGLCGDVVDVSPGYARNHLLPHHLALEPTKANLKSIEEDKKRAAIDRQRVREALLATQKRLEGVEVSINAACTPDGHLYGSVGPREIARCLIDEGHSVHTDQVKMSHNIKEVGTFQVKIVLTDDITSEIKLWVVAAKLTDDELKEQSETEVHDGEDAGFSAQSQSQGREHRGQAD